MIVSCGCHEAKFNTILGNFVAWSVVHTSRRVSPRKEERVQRKEENIVSAAF